MGGRPLPASADQLLRGEAFYGDRGIAVGSERFSHRELRRGTYAVGPRFIHSGVIILPFLATGPDEILETVQNALRLHRYLRDQVARLVAPSSVGWTVYVRWGLPQTRRIYTKG